MLENAGTEVMTDEHTEVALDAFLFDKEPVDRWRYECCVRAGVCPARRTRQPKGAATAVGMRWSDAQVFCAQREMQAQSPLQAMAIREKLRISEPALIEGDPAQIVTRGFRCTVSRRDRSKLAPRPVRVYVRPVENGRTVGVTTTTTIERALADAGWVVVATPSEVFDYEIQPIVRYSGFKTALELNLLKRGSVEILARASGGAADSIPRETLIRDLGDCLLGRSPLQPLCKGRAN